MSFHVFPFSRPSLSLCVSLCSQSAVLLRLSLNISQSSLSTLGSLVSPFLLSFLQSYLPSFHVFLYCTLVDLYHISPALQPNSERFQHGSRTVLVFRGVHFRVTSLRPQRLKPNKLSLWIHYVDALPLGMLRRCSLSRQ
jgi:hypothetical protein